MDHNRFDILKIGLSDPLVKVTSSFSSAAIIFGSGSNSTVPVLFCPGSTLKQKSRAGKNKQVKRSIIFHFTKSRMVLLLAF